MTRQEIQVVVEQLGFKLLDYKENPGQVIEILCPCNRVEKATALHGFTEAILTRGLTRHLKERTS